MTKTKVYCDHCGVEIEPAIGYIDDEIAIVGSHKKCDLCEDCVEDLVKLVEDFLLQHDCDERWA